MSSKPEFAVRFTAREKAELVETQRDEKPLGDGEIEGKTIVSLISAGTEVVGIYRGTLVGMTDDSYPCNPGYAAVFKVERVGSEVKDFKPGDLAFAPGNHRSFQRVGAGGAVRVPAGLSAERAVFARMIKISMPSFVHTRVRPPEKVMVTGLGIVGLMAAQLAQQYGYDVCACEPDAARRQMAKDHGVRNVLSEVPLSDEAFKKKVGLGIECAGHEQAVLDLCNIVRPRGEVFLVGVPWEPRTEMLAQKVLHSVFYNYVGLHCGWEGRMPSAQDIHSANHHHRLALDWLADERIKVSDALYKKLSPSDPQPVYQDIRHGRLEAPTAMFDWSEV